MEALIKPVSNNYTLAFYKLTFAPNFAKDAARQYPLIIFGIEKLMINLH